MEFLEANGRRIAYERRKGTGPGVVFLGGFRSDMTGTKAQALDDWAMRQGRAFLRFDYFGHGQSSGDFLDGSIGDWAQDAMAAIGALTEGPQVLVGSSMGGWIALLVARAVPGRVAGLVGIAAAPDFTIWGFTDDEKAKLQSDGKLLRPSDYGPEPMLTTHGFWQSGQDNLLLDKGIDYAGPVRLLQGQSDEVVPWKIALRTADALRSDDVQVTLIKDGDHRLSRAADIDLLIGTVATLMETL